MRIHPRTHSIICTVHSLCYGYDKLYLSGVSPDAAQMSKRYAAAAAARYASAANAAGITPDTAAATTDAARAAATTLNTTNCFISSNT